MKLIIKRIPKSEKTLWQFIRHHLTESLECVSRSEGYGVRRLIYEANEKKKLFKSRSEVAEVDDKEVTLYDPKWAEDFKDCMGAYEKMTNEDTTLIIWQGH